MELTRKMFLGIFFPSDLTPFGDSPLPPSIRPRVTGGRYEARLRFSLPLSRPSVQLAGPTGADPLGSSGTIQLRSQHDATGLFCTRRARRE